MTLELAIPEPVLVSLVFVRVLAVVLLAPVFSHQSVSMRIRTALAFGLALLIAPGIAQNGVLPGSLVLAVMSEFTMGMAIGLVGAMVLAPVGLMAEVVSVQGGLAAATALDPTSEASSVVLGGLMRLTATLLFLAIDGHHEVIRALWLSFDHVPLGTWPAVESLGAIALFGGVIFEAGLRLAAPLTIVLLVSNVVVGSLGRLVPQLNLMSLQLPAQIALTLSLIAIGAGNFLEAVAVGIGSMLELGLGTALGGY